MKNRLTAKDFDQRILELYDHYAHGKIDKREFLKRAGKYAAAGVTALTIFNSLAPNYALAEQVSFNDPDIKANYITYRWFSILLNSRQPNLWPLRALHQSGSSHHICHF